MKTSTRRKLEPVFVKPKLPPKTDRRVKNKKNLDKNWSRMAVGGSTKQGNIDRVRNLDGYNTPDEAVEALLQAEKLHTRIWEPANGFNKISNYLEDAGKTVHRSDIYQWSKRTKDLQDFTAPTVNTPFKGKPFDIVTNPPFVKAVQFVETAMNNLQPGRQLCLLLRLQFLEGKKRKLLFKKYPPHSVYVFSYRLPRMHRFDFDKDAWMAEHTGKAEPSSALCFAWFCWRKEKTPVKQSAVATQLKWI